MLNFGGELTSIGILEGLTLAMQIPQAITVILYTFIESKILVIYEYHKSHGYLFFMGVPVFQPSCFKHLSGYERSVLVFPCIFSLKNATKIIQY